MKSMVFARLTGPLCRAAALCLALVWGSGCGGTRAEPDRTSPEATLAGFFAAIAHAGEADLEAFIADDGERALWQFRCRERGCNRAEHRVVARDEAPDHAVLFIEYAVYGKGGGRIMHGKRSPVHLVRHGSSWRITRVGERVVRPANSIPKRTGPEKPGVESPLGFPTAGPNRAQ